MHSAIIVHLTSFTNTVQSILNTVADNNRNNKETSLSGIQVYVKWYMSTYPSVFDYKVVISGNELSLFDEDELILKIHKVQINEQLNAVVNENY
jgi:hypothetical protein